MPFLSVATAVGIYFLASIFVNSKARSFIKMWFAAVVVFESLVGLIMYFPYPNCYFNTAAGANVMGNGGGKVVFSSSLPSAIRKICQNL